MKNLFIAIFILILCFPVYSQVTQEWVSIYNSPSNGNDYAKFIAVDGSGNIYTAGFSDSAITGRDYAIVKYNSAGTQQWVQRYNGPTNTYDVINSMIVDASGNVYVTGFSDAGSLLGTDADYATIKYNTEGIRQWIQRYNGPGDSNDVANSIAVDDLGNVYVTGYSFGNGNADYSTIKYNSSGVQQWVQRYDSISGNDYGVALVIDPFGNVYVTGNSEGDYATVKYNSSGVQQWTQRYSGIGNSYDLVVSIAADNSGNVCITGESYGTSSLDYATIKYNSSGVQEWIQRYNGPNDGADEATSIAIDNSGNVYVTGYSYGNGSPTDYATVKYNADGVQQWAQRYNGPSGFYDYAYSLDVDNSGNVYVTGSSRDIDFSNDCTTVKYNSNGSQEWVRRYKGSQGTSSGGNSVAVDNSGNVYVAGYSYQGTSPNDFTTIKYSQGAGVNQISQNIPDRFHLSQNYPNPFNPTTKIQFDLPKSSFTTLKIYNAIGKEIANLTNEFLQAGSYESEWNASNYPSGVYYYSITAGNYSETKKMILVK